jgi:hypothetical protein
MQRFCQNPCCENEAVSVVPVSIRKAADHKKSLCSACQEVYTWGVQHGTMTALHAAAGVDQFLMQGGFVVITHNASDPSVHGALEAWAYRGMLDFDVAHPVTFGVGPRALASLPALRPQQLL